MTKKGLQKKVLIAVFALSITSCMPKSAIPELIITPISGLNPGNPTDNLNPNNPAGDLPSPDPGNQNPNNPSTDDPTGDLPHPPPPDPNQPTTEDDFWKLMQRFGFMQKRTKADLQADIKSGVVLKITTWSPGTVKDVNKNILAKYTDADTKKYMNPYPKTVEEYAQKSFALAKRPNSEIDFYLDVEYGAKDGLGRINLQKVEPKTLEVLYFNKSAQINNYTQTAIPKTGGPPPLLRLTHFMFIPPAVYK